MSGNDALMPAPLRAVPWQVVHIQYTHSCFKPYSFQLLHLFFVWKNVLTKSTISTMWVVSIILSSFNDSVDGRFIISFTSLNKLLFQLFWSKLSRSFTVAFSYPCGQIFILPQGPCAFPFLVLTNESFSSHTQNWKRWEMNSTHFPHELRIKEVSCCLLTQSSSRFSFLRLKCATESLRHGLLHPPWSWWVDQPLPDFCPLSPSTGCCFYQKTKMKKTNKAAKPSSFCENLPWAFP